MTLQAIIFGSIGTLTETSDLQRAAFNAAFAENGLGWHWSAEVYQHLVAEGTSGGEARIAAFAADRGEPPVDSAMLHSRKSALFQTAMAANGLRPNAGVTELIAEARAAGVRIAMASTTSARNITAMFAATAPDLSAAMFDVVTSADSVTRGKPAPDVYFAVLAQLGVDADAVVAIEDTIQSAASPRAAGIATIVVPGAIALQQDFGRLPVAKSVKQFGGLAAFRALLADATAPV